MEPGKEDLIGRYEAVPQTVKRLHEGFEFGWKLVVAIAVIAGWFTKLEVQIALINDRNVRAGDVALRLGVIEQKLDTLMLKSR